MAMKSSMQYKNLGRTGLKVSQLSYGAWVSFGNQLDVKEAKGLLQCCRDYGVNFFDNAEVYANGRAEEIMGQAMKELGWKRSDLVVSTKLFWGGPGPNDKGLSRKHIVEGTRASLTRLGMDYVDVLFCHRPDTSTPIEETVRAMNYVIDNGWAFYWGTSEWNAQQITEAWEVAKRLDMVGPSCEQPEYNLFSRHKVEVEYASLYNNYGLGLTTWSPLSSGVLTGKYSKGNIPQDSRFALDNYKNLASRSLVDDVLRKVDGLKPIAAELDVPLAQLAIAWCASNPNVSTVITGATKESQIHENMKALDVIPKLNADILERIESVIQSKPKRPESYRFHVALFLLFFWAEGIISKGGTLPPSRLYTESDEPIDDFPPGFSEVAHRTPEKVSGAGWGNLSYDKEASVIRSPVSTDPFLGSPLPPSYREILVAHLPVYSDKNPPKVGVSPFSSDRFRDVTVRRQRKKGGRGGRGKKTSFSSEGDSYIPLSKRLSHGSEGLEGT